MPSRDCGEVGGRGICHGGKRRHTWKDGGRKSGRKEEMAIVQRRRCTWQSGGNSCVEEGFGEGARGGHFWTGRGLGCQGWWAANTDRRVASMASDGACSDRVWRFIGRWWSGSDTWSSARGVKAMCAVSAIESKGNWILGVLRECAQSIPTRLAKCGGFGACKLQSHLVCQAGGMRSLMAC